jgi:hypothetical protein
VANVVLRNEFVVYESPLPRRGPVEIVDVVYLPLVRQRGTTPLAR